MPHPASINPKTGKRYNFVDPRQAEIDAAHEERELEKSLALIERQQAALRARGDLLTYTQFTMPDPEAPNDVKRTRYEAAKVHRGLGKALTEFVNGELLNEDGSVCNQLIVCMPPRHGKTEKATKRLTAWVSGKFPAWDIAVASYSDTMAEDMGADTRAILATMQHKQVFPDYKLRRGGTSKSNIQTDRGGRLVFVGRGGALTGRGMHLGIGDDLFKDHEEARSQAVRDAAWNWFTKVFMTRRMGRKMVILTMTRWHSDDIIGRITDPENPHYNPIEAKKWKIIRLPAIAEEDDPLGRAPGEALWPERYDLDFLESQQRLDPLGFAALYQQSPTVADGTLFRRENIRRYHLGGEDSILPKDLRWYCASDHAVGEKQRNDPSCFIKAGVDRHDNLWLTEVFWERVPADRQVEQMLVMGRGNSAPLLWFAGKDHITKSIGPFLRKRMVEEQTYINVVEMSETGDKTQKAQSIAARVAIGKVYIPHGLVWDRAVEQLLAFPNGTHDDFVDALAHFGRGLNFQFKASAPPKAQERAKFGTLAWVKEHDKWVEARKRAAALGGF